MTVTKHEVLTVNSAADAGSIRAAIDEIPSDAHLKAVEIDDEWGMPVATLTFRREVTNE